MLPYTLRQLVWMLTSALQLIYALSTGIVWVIQMLRLFAYGACVGICFIPHWWWYLTSPNIIRRVSYRSSDTTKRRNILRVLEAEGVDLREVLRNGRHQHPQQQQQQRSTLPPPQPLPLGMRRRRVMAGPHSEAVRAGDGLPEEGRGSGRRRGPVGQRGGRRSAGQSSLGPRLPSDVATLSASRCAPWEADACRSHGGEVVEAADLHPHCHDGPRSGSSCTSPPLRYQQQTPLGVAGNQLSSGARRRRPPPRPANDAPPSSALARLMDAAQVDLNPADGSALRSLPVKRAHGRDASSSAASGGGLMKERDAARVVTAPPPHQHQQQQQSSRQAASSPGLVARTPPLLGQRKDMKQSSSSSCDMTLNRPENSSGDDDRGVGAVGPARDAARASTTPQLKSAAAAPLPVKMESAGSFEGRAVYYEALPRADIPDDPLLKDVLAALQEDDARREEEEEQGDVAVGREEQQRRASQPPQLRRTSPAQQGLRRTPPPPPQHQQQQHLRRAARPPQQQQQHHQQQRSPSPSQPSFHARTFSEEEILAGLDDEDEEDRMNLHNRATVDIVLPVPLDSLMKTLEYTQHSTRLRRKRFPVIIDVSGAVWIIGSHLWSTMMARILAQRGYVVFCPDYRNFPQTTMEGMTLDVSDAVAWVLNNAERYNGDLNNVTLIGQSAGAHLTMMSLLSQAQLSAYHYNTLRGHYETVPPPSDVAYNVPRYNPRESIHRYVGLSGMYNIEELVDHFQREGLNTPVLHQIAGGRDQLARYSIHAYLDDRRNGDTGEVLPDNIFDYFPQRMFFVHGDADKCAPVTESASLVAMLRRAQERNAARREERNTEARRHALRSRRLLPGALAPGNANSSASATAATVASGGTAGILLSTAAGGGEGGGWRERPARQAGRPQWRAEAEEGGNRRAASRSLEPHDAIASDDSYPEGEKEREEVWGERGEEEGLYDPLDRYGAPQPQPGVSAAPLRRSANAAAGPASVSASTASAAVVSPIVPPSRHDPPRPPVELEFIVIPHGRHSDAFVDECIAAGRSCCVDFLCDYESAVDCPSSTLSASHSRGLDGGDSVCGSQASGDGIPAWMAQSSEPCAMPDGILPLAVPAEERSLPLRLCTLICPF